MSEASEVKKVSFTLLGEPRGKERPRVGKFGHVFTPGKTRAYERDLKMEYQAQCGNYRFPDDAMLDLRIYAFYGIPKSGNKLSKELKRKGVIRPTKKPDMDNVVKIVADALNELAYEDDTHIVDCQVRKFYSDTPRVIVELREVGRIPETTKRRNENV